MAFLLGYRGPIHGGSAHGGLLQQWIDNGSLTTPGDLGYCVGYRIVKSYYDT